MEHTKHLWRAVLILVVIAIGGVVGRHFMIPESFGKEGHYRYDSLLGFMEKSPVHGAPGSCAKCHADQQKSNASGRHAGISCETCHAPLTTHAANGEKIGDMLVDKSYGLCLRCHEKLEARPKEFSQVMLKEHLSELGLAKIPDKICKVCHDPHNPKKPD